MNGCCACDGPLVLLGVLGNRAHLRCRDCGADQSVDAAEIADELDEEADAA